MKRNHDLFTSVLGAIAGRVMRALSDAAACSAALGWAELALWAVKVLPAGTSWSSAIETALILAQLARAYLDGM